MLDTEQNLSGVVTDRVAQRFDSSGEKWHTLYTHTYICAHIHTLYSIHYHTYITLFQN